MNTQIGRGSPPFQVRFPEGMREQIKILAAQNRRSMNAEIVFRLTRDMEKDGAFMAEAEGRNGGGESLEA